VQADDGAGTTTLTGRHACLAFLRSGRRQRLPASGHLQHPFRCWTIVVV